MSDREYTANFRGTTDIDAMIDRIAASADRAEKKIPGFGKALAEAARNGQNSLTSLMQTLEAADAGFERSISKRRTSAEVEAERQARHQAKIQRILEQSAAAQVAIQNNVAANIERIQATAEARREAQRLATAAREKQEAVNLAADLNLIRERYLAGAGVPTINGGVRGSISPASPPPPGARVPATGGMEVSNIAAAAAQFETLTDKEKQALAAAQAFERELDRVAQKTQEYGPELRTTLGQMRTQWEQMSDKVADTYADMDVPSSVIRSLDAMERKVISLEQAFTKVGASLQTRAATPAALKSQEQAMEHLFNKIELGAHQSRTSMEALDATLRKHQDAAYMAENGLRKVDGELRQKPADAAKADKAMRGLGDTFKDMWKQFVVGSVASQVVMRALDGITAAAKSLIDNNAQIEKFEMTYVRFFGNVAAAKAEMDQVIKEAPKFPEELQDIVALDQKLIGLLGTPAKMQDRFGRSMSDVRKAILDTKATLSNVDTSNVARDLQLLQDKPGDALRSLEKMSILTKKELAEQGIQFDVHGKNIYSSYEDTFNAVIKIMENRYGGMAEVQSSTFSGMLANTKDFLFRATSYLGADVFADIRERFKGFLDTFDDTKNPGVTRTLQDWGVKIGKVWNAFMTFFDDVGKGVGVLLTVLRPVTDMLGWLIDQLPSSVASQKDGWDNLAKAAGYVADNVEDQAEATQVVATRQRELEDALKANERAADGIRNKYDKQLESLSDQERSLDRIYQKGKEDRQISELRLKIAADMALAQDKGSAQGRSAAERLVGEQRQLTDLYAEQAHNKEKDRLQDAKTKAERDRDKELDQNKQSRYGIQDELDDLRQQLDFANKLKSSYGEVSKAHRQNVDDQSAANQDWLGSSDKTTSGIITGLNKITETINGDKGLKMAVDDLKDSWDKLMGAFGLTPNGVQPAEDSLQGLIKKLGLDEGAARAALVFKFAFLETVEAVAASASLYMTLAGNTIGQVTDNLRVAAAYMSFLMAPMGSAEKWEAGRALQLAQGEQSSNDVQRNAALERAMTTWGQHLDTATRSNFDQMWKDWMSVNNQYAPNPGDTSSFSTGFDGPAPGVGEGHGPDSRPNIPRKGIQIPNLIDEAKKLFNTQPNMTPAPGTGGWPPANMPANSPLPGEHGHGASGSTEVTLKVAGAGGEDWVLGKLRMFRNELGQMVAQQVLGAM